MPQLKQISCCIQWADTNAPFQEHGTVYGDGVVETFVIVPNKPQRFCIRLTSRGFICEGLAMIVFIDGDYQCNRTRFNLRPSEKGKPASRTEVDFLLRQKEKPQGDGVYMGREWRFDNHNIVAEAPAGFQESHFDDLGTIEVLVLRCRARNREEAECEETSSGEDSDFFGEKPEVDEEEEAKPAAEPEAEIGGLFGLFDGANDYYDVANHDGGYDGHAQGKWVWQQQEPPSSHDFSQRGPLQHPLPPGDRFRSSSYGVINHHAASKDSHQPQRTYSSPPSQPKRVHWDYGPYVQQPPQHPQFHQLRQSSQNWTALPNRPDSRERLRSSERRTSRDSSRHSGPPYGPQNVSANHTNDYREQNRASRGTPSQPKYFDQPRTEPPPVMQEDAYSNPQYDQFGRSNAIANGTPYHAEPPPVPRPEYDLSYYEPQQRASSHEQRPQYYHEEPLPSLNQPTHILPQFQDATPIHSASRIAAPSQYVAPPVPVYPRAPLPYLPNYYPQYWPGYPQGLYQYPGMPYGQQNLNGLHPLHQYTDDQISPKNTTLNGPGQDGDVQDAPNQSQDANGNAQGAANGQGGENEPNSSSNQNTDTNQGGGWDNGGGNLQNSPHDNCNSKINDQEGHTTNEYAWDNTNTDTNGGNDSWYNNNSSGSGNTGGDGWDADANNNAGNENSWNEDSNKNPEGNTSWDVSANANDTGSAAANKTQRISPQIPDVINKPREL